MRAPTDAELKGSRCLLHPPDLSVPLRRWRRRGAGGTGECCLRKMMPITVPEQGPSQAGYYKLHASREVFLSALFFASWFVNEASGSQAAQRRVNG